MDKAQAIFDLQKLEGRDLRALADEHGITYRSSKTGKVNKGWAGHTVERYLGLPLGSSREPNLGGWELKVIPLRRIGDGRLDIKETMAITMLDEEEVKAKDFRDSHLFTKICRLVVVSRIVENDEIESIVHKCRQFRLDESGLLRTIEADYEKVRSALWAGQPLSGKMGKLVQPRTKGPGHGSTSRAFYARKELVARIIGRDSLIGH